MTSRRRQAWLTVGVVVAKTKRHKLRVAVFTMARDEGDMLKRWLAYYGDQLGVENLLVIDDNSVDGSTKNLPCNVYRLPPPPWKKPWVAVRRRIVNDISRALLTCYDVAIVTDVDEFLVPDPTYHDGLMTYLRSRSDQKVIAPLAINLLHNARLEPALDPNRPVAAQRRFVKFAPGMCKPLIKRIPADWMAAFHGIRAPFEVDRELLMLHLKYCDVGAMQQVWEHRYRIHREESRGAAVSEWALDSNELTSRLAAWVDTDDPDAVPEFDPGEIDLTGLVRRKKVDFFRVHGVASVAMEKQPLRRLPERFRNTI